MFGAIKKRSHEPDLKNDTKNRAKRLCSIAKLKERLLLIWNSEKSNIAIVISFSPTVQSVPKKDYLKCLRNIVIEFKFFYCKLIKHSFEINPFYSNINF